MIADVNGTWATTGFQEAYGDGYAATKLPAMTEAEMLQLLASDGMLVKRPLLIGDDFVLVGFQESKWNDI